MRERVFNVCQARYVLPQALSALSKQSLTAAMLSQFRNDYFARYFAEVLVHGTLSQADAQKVRQTDSTE